MDYHDVSAIPPSLGFFADETSVHVEHWFDMWERISVPRWYLRNRIHNDLNDKQELIYFEK